MCSLCDLEAELELHCGMEEKEANAWILKTFGFKKDVELFNWLSDNNITLDYLEGPNIKAYLKMKAVQLGRCK